MHTAVVVVCRSQAEITLSRRLFRELFFYFHLAQIRCFRRPLCSSEQSEAGESGRGPAQKCKFWKNAFYSQMRPPNPPSPRHERARVCVFLAHIFWLNLNRSLRLVCVGQEAQMDLHALRVGVFPPCKAAKFSPLLGAFALATSTMCCASNEIQQDKWTKCPFWCSFGRFAISTSCCWWMCSLKDLGRMTKKCPGHMQLEIQLQCSWKSKSREKLFLLCTKKDIFFNYCVTYLHGIHS